MGFQGLTSAERQVILGPRQRQIIHPSSAAAQSVMPSSAGRV
ncbi:MAG: hypothetical protein ACRDZY_00340 [Acidimicrobiales bacterium]